MVDKIIGPKQKENKPEIEYGESIIQLNKLLLLFTQNKQQDFQQFIQKQFINHNNSTQTTTHKITTKLPQSIKNLVDFIMKANPEQSIANGIINEICRKTN